ncbi:unnamed protein product, partial [Meganyctiphanes norvegica]
TKRPKITYKAPIITYGIPSDSSEEEPEPFYKVPQKTYVAPKSYGVTSAPSRNYNAPSGPACPPSDQDPDQDCIIGIGGKDYPIYRTIPETSFTCEGRIPGYYADPETQCQAWHYCQGSESHSRHSDGFLCPNGTIFNQRHSACVWWYEFDCVLAEGYYHVNDKLYSEESSEESSEEGEESSEEYGGSESSEEDGGEESSEEDDGYSHFTDQTRRHFTSPEGHYKPLERYRSPERSHSSPGRSYSS